MPPFAELHLRARRAWDRAQPADVALWAGLVAVIAVAMQHRAAHRFFLFDDAHITFRHADNLAHGRGLVFNPGERVEGTSAFLFALILAVPMIFGAAPLAVAQLVGALATAALVAYVFATVRLFTRGARGGLLALGAALATAWATPIAAYAMSGMETSLYVALLVAALHHHLRDPASRASAALFALAALTRPEGAGMFAVVQAIALARALREGGDLRRALRPLATFAAIFAPFLVFRLAYYGELVPNTVVAKSTFQHRLLAMPRARAIAALRGSDGAKILPAFLDLAFGPLALLGAAALFVRRTRHAAVVLSASAFAVALVCLWNEGDWMPHYRLLVPLVPLVFIALALGLAAFLEIDPRRAAGRAAPIVAGLAVLLYLADRAHYERAPAKRSLDAAEKHLIDLGRKLAAVRRPDDLLATDIAGIIPLYARMPTIDMLGLCDRHIAHHGTDGGKMGKWDLPYTFSRRPTFYVLNFVTVLRDVYRHPAFARDADAYWLVRTPYDRDPKNPARDKKVILVRKDRPGLDELRRVLEAELVDPRTLLPGGR
jgi:hypothetical protein